jgi:hypothetical protein
MTLCIAAICEDKEDTQPKIVLCTDLQREQEGIGSSETEEKIGFVRQGWPTLLAGTISKANELLNVYAGYLSEHFHEIDEFNILDHLRKPAHLQKQKSAVAITLLSPLCTVGSRIQLILWAAHFTTFTRPTASATKFLGLGRST